MRYRGKPIEIEALEWRGQMEDIPRSWRRTGRFWFGSDGLEMQTLKGESDVHVGEFIVRRCTGEMYPVDPLTFHEHYEALFERVGDS